VVMPTLLTKRKAVSEQPLCEVVSGLPESKTGACFQRDSLRTQESSYLS